MIYAQITQQIFVAKEWIRKAYDETKAKAHSWLEVERDLRALRAEHAGLSERLKEVDKAHLSAKASLKTVERQAEDQR